MAETLARLKDADWVKQSFMLSDKDITNADMLRRLFTTAAFKFTDTTIGGSFAINMPPQFTRYADLRTGGGTAGSTARRDYDFDGNSDPSLIYSGLDDSFRGLRANNARSMGMGRYYAEHLEEWSQLVHLRFGVPEFNSMLTFLGNFYSAKASLLARTGRSSMDFFTAPLQTVAGAAGSVTGMLLAAPFYPFILGGRVIRTLGGFPATKFYYLKPAMALYRDAVNNICNGIAVNMGVSPYSPADARNSLYNDQTVFSPEYRAAFHRMLPDIIGADGLIDVYALSTRAQRIANVYNERLREAQGTGVRTMFSSLQSNLRSHMQSLWRGDAAIPAGRPLTQYLNDYFQVAQNQGDGGINGAAAEQVGDRSQYNIAGRLSKWFDLFEGERRDGGEFVTFRVDPPAPPSESFSNQVRESDLSSKMNSMSAQARSKRFDFSDGNVLGSTVKGLTDAVGQFFSEALDKVQASGLMAISGLAYVDIPKVWENSTAQLPRADFSFQLRTPYGNKMSRFLYLQIPLAHILAGVLPLSTGTRSYTSPFLCECYSRGRCAIRLGMIDSLTITRAVGNLGWNQDNEALGYDVSFSVVDLSSVMHMPIVSRFGLLEKAGMAAASAAGAAADAAAGTDGGIQNGAEAIAAALSASAYDDDNSYSDYLAVLGSLSLQEMTLGTRKIALQYARRRQEFATWKTPGHFASMFAGSLPGRIVRAVALGTDRTD